MVRLILGIVLICLLESYTYADFACTEFNPCKNMAECIRHDYDPTRVRCNCKRGFNGNLCQIWPQSCSTDFCFNGGTCILVKRIPRCICHNEYKGLFCEIYNYSNLLVQQNSINEFVANSTVVYQPAGSTDSPVYSFVNNFEPNSKLIESNQPIVNQQYTIITTTLPSTTTESTTTTTEPTTTTTFTYPPTTVEVTASPNYRPLSICDFEPCLNYGNCIDISNSNSAFKFRCACPENYGGILCENYLSPIPVNVQYHQSYNLPPEPKTSTYIMPEQTNPPTFPSTTTPITTTTESTTTSTTTTTTTTTEPSTTTTTTSTTSTTPAAYFSELFNWVTTTTTSSRPAFLFGNNEKKMRKFSLCAQLRPCSNNGQCIDTVTDLTKHGDGIQRFKCICRPEFTGVFCHIRINRRSNFCAYNLCLNSGECVPSRDNNGFSCVCPPNYTGKFCELNSY